MIGVQLTHKALHSIMFTIPVWPKSSTRFTDGRLISMSNLDGSYAVGVVRIGHMSGGYILLVR